MHRFEALLNVVLRGVAYAVLAIPSLLFGAAFAMGGGGLWSVLALLFMGAVFFTALLVHELGHAYAARRFGWPITLVAVAPVAYDMRTRRLRFWMRAGEGFGGVVECRPLPGRSYRARLAWLAFAGPLANLLLALIVVVLAQIPFVNRVAMIFAPLGAVSLFLGIGNLVPFKTRRGARSDGWMILRALREQRSEAFLKKLIEPR
jgi:hypothetical protein